MSFGHSSSGHPYLDGVEFRLAEVFMGRTTNSYDDFDMKDPEVVLEDFEYDFTLENAILEDVRRKKQEKEEARQKEAQRKEAEKRELEELHKQHLMEKQKEEELKKILHKDKLEQSKEVEKRVSPSNPFFNDLVSNGILKPQPAPRGESGHGRNQKTPIDVLEFENDNQDPFSNMELKTIDDLQELKDVLQNVSSTSGKTSPETEVQYIHGDQVNYSPEVNGLEGTEINSKKEQKKVLISELTDLLTDDIETANEPENLPEPSAKISAPSVFVPNTPQTTHSSVLPQYFNANPSTSFLPPITLDLGSNAASQASASPTQSTASVGRSSPANVIYSNEGGYTELFDLNRQRPSPSPVVTPRPGSGSSKSLSPEPEYVNVTKPTKPAMKKPKPTPRTHIEKESPPKTDDLKPNSYGAVRNKVLANKSAAERAKFEDTINKALTSLPQLPTKPKPPDSKSDNTKLLPKPQKPLASAGPKSPGILSGLSEEERQFVRSCMTMGFKEHDVIRTMQRYGTDHKQVTEHLCTLQSFLDQDFKTKNIEEALDIFNGNKKETLKYLQLESQFLDMGFSSDKIKEALLLSDGNPQKALGVLMGDT